MATGQPTPSAHPIWMQSPCPGFDWGGWFTVLQKRGAQGMTTDDDPVYGPARDASGLDRQPCAVHGQRTVGRHSRGLDEDALPHLDRILLPVLQRLARERVMALWVSYHGKYWAG